MNIRKIRNAPPPASSVKKVLLCCLFLIVFLALPIASQAQSVPAQLTNPTALAPCGLPVSWSQFNSDATVTTFNLTADCTFSNSNVQANSAVLHFTAGEFTINGNGHSIIAPSNGAFAIYVQNTGAVLNLNNVTITGGTAATSILVRNGRLNARSIIFSGNTTTFIMAVDRDGGQIYAESVQFLGNTGAGTEPAVVSVGTNGLVSITSSIFEGNTDFNALIDARGTVQLHGCLTLGDNPNTQNDLLERPPSGVILGSPRACYRAQGHTIIAAPPKKKEKVPTATPTSRPRPQIAATHVALQAATGATFRATYGLDSGVHFRQLDGAGIGVQSIIDAGYLEAFDVWGYVEQGVEVCFPQVGRVIFLDANTSPRAIVPLESTVANGQTCVSINSPGSLVLLPN